MNKTRDNRGRFQPQNDWGDLIPKIIDEYIEGTPIAVQCRNKNYPSWRQTMRVIKSNPEFLEKYKMAIWAKWQLLTDEYGELYELADRGFRDKSVNIGAIEVILKVLNHRQWNLERMAATYGVRLYGPY